MTDLERKRITRRLAKADRRIARGKDVEAETRRRRDLRCLLGLLP